MIPWYNNYKGTIIKKEEKKYTSTGILEKKGNTWIIKELPIGIWIDNYKQALEELLENKKIKSLKNYSTTDNVHFEIQLFENYSNIEHDKAIELFSLNSTINLNNMVVLGDNGTQIEKYNSIVDILTSFSDYRLEMYKKRKVALLDNLQNQIDKLQSKLKFIKAVVNDEIIIGKISKTQLLDILASKNFKRVDDSFDYLVNIPIYDFTLDSIQKLEKNIIVSTLHCKTEKKILPKSTCMQPKIDLLSSTAYMYALQNIYLYLCIATHIHSHDVQIMTRNRSNLD